MSCRAMMSSSASFSSFRLVFTWTEGGAGARVIDRRARVAPTLCPSRVTLQGNTLLPLSYYKGIPSFPCHITLPKKISSAGARGGAVLLCLLPNRTLSSRLGGLGDMTPAVAPRGGGGGAAHTCSRSLSSSSLLASSCSRRLPFSSVNVCANTWRPTKNSRFWLQGIGVWLRSGFG